MITALLTLPIPWLRYIIQAQRCASVQAGGRVHDLPEAATQAATEDHRLLRTSLPRQNVRWTEHIGWGQRMFTRGQHTTSPLLYALFPFFSSPLLPYLLFPYLLFSSMLFYSLFSSFLLSSVVPSHYPNPRLALFCSCFVFCHVFFCRITLLSFSPHLLS